MWTLALRRYFSVFYITNLTPTVQTHCDCDYVFYVGHAWCAASPTPPSKYQDTILQRTYAVSLSEYWDDSLKSERAIAKELLYECKLVGYLSIMLCRFESG